MKQEETKVVRMVMKMNIKQKRGRGRTKNRWLNMIENIKTIGVGLSSVR
jgi:hypothetical protein